MYTTGLQVDWGLFSKDIVGAIVGEYIYVTEQLSDRREKKITTLCGMHVEEQQPKVNSFNHCTMYEPSSPMKGSNSE
jgi:hypothetical protein